MPTGDLSTGLGVECQMRFLDEIEEVVIPNIRLDDAPAAGKGLGEAANLGHQPVSAMSFGSRTRLLGSGYEGEGPSDTVATAELVWCWSATTLIQRFLMRWLSA